VIDTVATLRAAGCVFAEEEARLLHEAAPDPAGLAALVARRCAGEPLEQVVGWAEFAGRRVAVAPGVFVPRLRSVALVRLGATLARGGPVVDLCCGTGAIGLAIHAAAGGPLYAADISAAAVRVARRNLAPVGGHVLLGDLYAPLPPHLRGRVHLIAANVPYVPSAEVELMPAEARLHEPRGALDGGPDGLDLVRRVARDARRWLAPGGHLLVEASARQAARAARIFAAAGLRPHVTRFDEWDAWVISGRAAGTLAG